VVSIDCDGLASALLFAKESEGALLPAREPELQGAARAAATFDGRAIPLVSTFAAAERLPPVLRQRT
jgi:hypothetical protein